MANASADDFAPDVAAELIEDFGIVEQWDIPGLRRYSVESGEVDNIDVQSVAVTVTPPLAYKKDFYDGDVKLQDVSYCFIRGDVSFTPSRGMRITINGKVWTVVSVKPLVSGRLTAAYALYVKA